MSIARHIICSCIVVSVATPLLVAHPDDPKLEDTMPAYVGPAYRAADGGVAGLGFDTEGVSLGTWLPVNQFGEHMNWANDCWGYTSPSGREYAILGLSHGTAFVEVTDPDDADVVATIVGPSSVWRDMKTYSHYAYAVSEGGNGIQVMNLANIDNGQVQPLANVTTGGLESTHNVAINEASGFLYRVGGSGNGLRFYDLNVTPQSPQFVGEWQERYVHDAVIVTRENPEGLGEDDTIELAFCCSGFNNGWVEPGIDVVDVTDKANPVNIERYHYPMAEYSHQAWVSEDGQYLFLNDEKDEQNLGLTTTIHIIDISDPFELVQVGTFTNGSTAVTHNLYIRGNELFAANYRSGLRIFNIADPLNPVETGHFDTDPGSNAPTFNGLWSSYPYFQSTTIIGSDREKGLFVWSYGPTDPIDADVNGDGVINVDDLVEVIVNWGPCDPTCPADVDGNGVVDVDDLVAVILAWS